MKLSAALNRKIILMGGSEVKGNAGVLFFFWLKRGEEKKGRSDEEDLQVDLLRYFFFGVSLYIRYHFS